MKKMLSKIFLFISGLFIVSVLFSGVSTSPVSGMRYSKDAEYSYEYIIDTSILSNIDTSFLEVDRSIKEAETVCSKLKSQNKCLLQQNEKITLLIDSNQN